MSKLEEEFGSAAKFISKHAGRKIDVPEALIPVFEPLEEYGVWNLPWFSESIAFRDKVNYPTSLDSLWPDAQAGFIGVAWDKWYGQYLNKKVGKGPTFPANKYDTDHHEEFNKLAKQVRSFETVEEVARSGLVAKLCDLYFESATKNTGYEFYTSFLRSGPRGGAVEEDWLDEEPLWKLAHFFTPPTELLKMLDTAVPGNARFSIKYLITPIFDKIVECVIAKWGSLRPVKALVHRKHNLPYPSPNGDLDCEICQELRDERELLCKELTLRTQYPNAGSIPNLQHHLSKDTLLGTKKWIAEQAENLENKQRLQEELTETLYKPSPVVKDPVIEEVVAFVTRLTKLGVSPNKAAETATKLIKLA